MREMTLEEMAMVTGGLETIVVTAPPRSSGGSAVSDYLSGGGASCAGGFIGTEPVGPHSIDEVVITAQINQMKALAQTGGFTVETLVQVGKQQIVTQTDIFPNGNAIDWNWVSANLGITAAGLGAAAKAGAPTAVPAAVAAAGAAAADVASKADNRAYGRK